MAGVLLIKKQSEPAKVLFVSGSASVSETESLGDLRQAEARAADLAHSTCGDWRACWLWFRDQERVWEALRPSWGSQARGQVLARSVLWLVAGAATVWTVREADGIWRGRADLGSFMA